MEDEAEKLAALCQRMGASPEQARRMATQLLKRSEQLAEEHGTTRVEALDHLLRVLISGREGKVGPDFPPSKG